MMPKVDGLQGQWRKRVCACKMIHGGTAGAYLQCDHAPEASVSSICDACGLVQVLSHQCVAHGVEEGRAQAVVLDLDQIVQAGHTWGCEVWFV